MKIRYTILKGRSHSELVNLVNDAIGIGYIPQGGVAVTRSDIDGYCFAQALVKVTEAEEAQKETQP